MSDRWGVEVRHKPLLLTEAAQEFASDVELGLKKVIIRQPRHIAITIARLEISGLVGYLSRWLLIEF